MLRTLLAASPVVGAVLLVLACASAAQASTDLSRPATRHRPVICDPRTTATPKVFRRRGTFGPLAAPSNRVQAGLTDTTARLLRASRAKLDDDEAAIQNDAPAAHIDLDRGRTPALRVLGLLSSSFDRLPLTTCFSPRSPRGPPAGNV
jgi:hypothetical protein